jgi:hypothetical protein
VNENGKCLGIQNGATGNGAQAIQWTCNNHLDQAWTLNVVTNQVINVGSTKAQKQSVCLALYAGTTNVIQWTCNGETDQDWQVTY